MEDLNLKPVQKAALALIQNDLRFLYTVIKRINPNESNYTPLFSYAGNNGEYIKAMSVIGGKYIKLLDATKEYPVDISVKYDVCDYGGFVKSPVGNVFSDKFVLFSVLCQINFIICCVDSWIREEISIKMRFAYLLYYSSNKPEIEYEFGY